MSDTYKLVFRGEVLEGQHAAVVRKRLGQLGGFADEALDKLFSGRPVVLKRAADGATAAKFQVLFRKAGARLRVLPVDAVDDETAASSPRTVPAQAAGADRRGSGAERDAGAGGLEALPAGSEVLRDSERTRLPAREVDTSGLSLEAIPWVVPDPAPEPEGPDVSHLSVAAVGSDLSPRSDAPAPAVTAPDLDVAEIGADLGPARAPVTPAVDVRRVSFEVAPAGTELGQRKSLAPPPAPDTSHLSLTDESGNGD